MEVDTRSSVTKTPSLPRAVSQLRRPVVQLQHPVLHILATKRSIFGRRLMTGFGRIPVGHLANQSVLISGAIDPQSSAAFSLGPARQFRRSNGSNWPVLAVQDEKSHSKNERPLCNSRFLQRMTASIFPDRRFRVGTRTSPLRVHRRKAAVGVSLPGSSPSPLSAADPQETFVVAVALWLVSEWSGRTTRRLTENYSAKADLEPLSPKGQQPVDFLPFSPVPY